MALKFLNKKGWHTGSLRNIENVWKAEQKHEAEQKKLEELRKQIVEERERSDFRLLQEQAGLVPKQERLEFLYDSGLAVGKGSSSSGGFKALEPPPPKPDHASASVSASSSNKLQQPGALFEEKQQSSNDAWRKLHSDPLLMIRQREQEALSRVKNNPVQMAMIRKSVEATKSKEKKHDEDAPRRKHRHKKKHDKESSSKHNSDSDNHTSKEGRKSRRPSSEDELSGGDIERRRSKSYKYKEGRSSKHHSDSDDYTRKSSGKSTTRRRSEDESNGGGDIERRSSSYKYKERRSPEPTSRKNVDKGRDGEREQKGREIGEEEDKLDAGRRFPVTRETKPPLNRKRNPVKLSEEERLAKLREMQMDAEIHEEQRWKRLKKAEERDVEEAIKGGTSKGRSFLDDVQKSVYGTAKGGSSTIEESVRRRTHYSQGRSEASEGNAFRR